MAENRNEYYDARDCDMKFSCGGHEGMFGDGELDYSFIYKLDEKEGAVGA